MSDEITTLREENTAYRVRVATYENRIEALVAERDKAREECGHVAKENRKDRDTFECVECGHQDHADVNAARNILKKSRAA